MTKIDSSGAVIFSKKSMAPIAQVGWFTGMDLAQDGDALIGLVQGKTNATSAASTFFWLQKMDLNGNVLWIKEIEPDPSATNPLVYVHDLKVVSDGYLIAGFAGEAFLLKVSKDGETVQWLTKFSNTKKSSSPTLSGRLHTDGKRNFLVAEGNPASNGLLFAQTDFSGKVAKPNCALAVNSIPFLQSNAGVSVWENVLLTRQLNGTTDFIFQATTAELAIIYPPNCPICEENCSISVENSAMPASCSQPTFSKVFEGQSITYEICLTADSALLLPFSNNTTIQKSNLAGDQIWNRTTGGSSGIFQAGFFQPTIDSGFLAVNPFVSAAMLFKFDKNGQKDWIQLPVPFAGLPSNTLFEEVAAAAPNGETGYLMTEYFADSARVFFQKFNKSGDTIWQKGFQFHWSKGTFHKLLALKNGDWLAVGSIRTVDPVTISSIVVRFSPTGDVIWKQRFRFGPPTEIWRAIENQDGSLVFLCNMDERIGLIKTDSAGLILQSKLIEWPAQIPFGNSAGFEKTKNGYAVLMVVWGGVPSSILAKFDENLNHLWSKKYQNSLRGMAYLPQNDQFFLTGLADNCSIVKTILLRTDSLGRVDGDCILSENIAASAVSVSVLNDTFPFFEIPERMRFQKLNSPTFQEILTENYFECRSFCEPPPPVCLLDLAVHLDSVACRDGSTSAFLTLCNESDSAFAGDVRLLFFDEDPIQNASKSLFADSFFVQLLVGQCLQIEVGDLQKAIQNGQIWAFLNEKAASFDVSGNQKIDTSAALKNECRRPNNLSKANFQPPVSPVFDLGPDRIFCGQTPVELVGPSVFFEYEWSDGSTDSAITVSSAGLYFLKTQDVCGNEFLDSVSVRLDSATVLDLPDLLICRPTEIEITGDFSKITWLPSAGLSCANCRKSTVEPPTSGVSKYLVIAETPDGCLASDTFLVRKGEARVPNVFTPDGDGLNDFFDVFTPENCPCRVVEMRVFNRWGQLVFEKMDFESGKSTGWDGRFESKPAPPDVYLFQIELEFSSSLRVFETGDVTLLR